jgi:hypothetical protein
VPLRSADDLFRSAVTQTLAALDLTAADEALRRLAWSYAEALDADPESLATLGPRLLSALESLQATPRARRASPPADPGPSRLEVFRGGESA